MKVNRFPFTKMNGTNTHCCYRGFWQTLNEKCTYTLAHKIIYVFTIWTLYVLQKKRLSNTVAKRIWHEQTAYNKRVQEGGVKVQAMMQRAYPRMCYAINQHAQLSSIMCGQRNPLPSIQSGMGILNGSFWLVTHDFSIIKTRESLI